MLSQYIPILILLALVLLIAAGLFIATHIISPRFRNRIKSSVYESGVPTQMEARLRYPVRFYIVAVMFILFDIEVVFLYPWAVVYRGFLSQGWFIFWEMFVFLAILFAGYIYLLKRGAFKWE
ncbi:MAG: NADH-quinone oxidoreductase subunit A [Calditrichia bacterium]